MITIELSDFDAAFLVDLLVNPEPLRPDGRQRLTKILVGQLAEQGIMGMAQDGSVVRGKG